MIEVSKLNIYPVKSLRGISLDTAILGIRGLTADRNWLVTDASGKFLTQRQLAKMATVGVSLAESTLTLEHSSISPLSIDLNRSREDPEAVTIWNDTCLAFDEGSDASKWLTEVLGEWRGQALKLFRFADEHTRPVGEGYLKGEFSHTAFADGFPFLVTSEESLARLNERLESNGSSRIPMDRFRPNVVIRGVEPFEEDAFETLTASSGSYEFGIRKPCQRCPIPSINQQTGEKAEPKEPLRTLVEMNTQPTLQGAFFGQNATLLTGEGETISVGDALTASKKVSLQ